MNKGPSLKYLDDPQKYCNLVTELIEKASDEWQNTWKSAILELFESSEYNIHSVNALLKVIEKAFKERKYHIRAQAFDCWQFFIKEVEKKAISEKLINVILIPLSASNHSVKIVLDAKLKAWLTLLRTNTLCKSISKEKGIPSLLKILYGPHTLETASSHQDFTELCGTIYGLMVRKCLKNDDNGVILSYLPKALPSLSHNQISQRLGKEIWIDVTEYVSTRKWPTMLFNYLLKTLENLLQANCDQDKTFMRELLPILICECNTYPVETIMPHLNLLLRCLFYSASTDFNIASTIEYLTKKFKKREQALFDELNKTLTDFAENYTQQLQKCWTAVVPSFCKWNKSEIDSDVYTWMLLFPVKHLHQEWNTIIQDCMQMCFENIQTYPKIDAFIRNVTRRLNTFLNNSENVPLSLLSAATCLCKVMLQKTKPSDDLTAIKDSLLTINEKLPSQIAVEGPQITLICKYLSCLLYFLNRYPEYDCDFAPIIRKHSGSIDADKDSKEYPVAQLLSKYTNKTKEDDKLSNVLNIIRTPPNKSANPASLAKSCPSANKLTNGNGSPFGVRSAGANKSNGTPIAQKSTSKDDDVQFVAIKPTPKKSPMTEHQKEMAKEKSYIPAMYEDLSQSQSHSDSQSALLEKVQPVIRIKAIDVIEENAVLPSNDTSGDSADEIPASLDFREAIRKDKLSVSFSSKKSLFSDPAPNNGTESSAQHLKRKSRRIESKVVDTASKKRARLSCPNRIQTSAAEQTEPTPAENPIAPLQPLKSVKKFGGRRKSVAEERKENAESAASAATTVECESQNLFVPKTQSKTPPPSSSSASSETKSARRKSLKSKSSNIEQPTRSPINTRKRRSILSTASDASSKNLSAFVIDDSCSEMDEPIVKKEKAAISTENGSNAVGSEDSSSSSSVVTVIAANGDVPAQTDSVMIVDEDIEQHIIVVDSASPLSASAETVPSSTETEQPQTAIESVKVTEEEETLIIESTIDEDRVKSVEEHERSASESVRSTSSSFNLALSESLKTDKNGDQQPAEKIAPDDQDKVDAPPPNEQLQPSDAPAEKAEDEIVPADVKEPVENGTASTSEDVNVSSASPVAGHSRALQMLQMVYNGPSTLTQPKGRFKSSARRSRVNTPPAASNRNSAGGVTARTAINSRPMKLLQVNGHAEGSIKPSPNKVVNFLDKKETLRYTPKECTSPSILKKPNLNGTLSPKSPKFVNFAERLTDTREYDVNDTNFLDSICSMTSQSDNLISDDEATSQETLYPCLHNCTDDIGNIAERLYLNQHQLDTLKRIGIETVGQLASASTSVGKSIPVGDNRVQRLRNALQAYDNDRKLKGLRAPSVRRKITYKSPVEVNSIIEILDDEPAAERERAVNFKGGNANKLAGDKALEPLVLVDMLSSEEVAAYQSGSPFKDAPSPRGETQESSSPFGETQRVANSLVSPPLNDSTDPAESQTALDVASSTAHPLATDADSSEVSPAAIPLSPSKAASAAQAIPTSADKDLPPSSLAANTTDDRPSASDECKQSPTKEVLAPSISDTGRDQIGDDRERHEGAENARDPVVDEHKKTEVAEALIEMRGIDAEMISDDSAKEPGSPAQEPPIISGEFVECTQDEEQAFIFTNDEKCVFPNRNRRTYSKSTKTTKSMTNARKQVAVVIADAESKCSSSESPNVGTNVSKMEADASRFDDDLVVDTSSADEQSSVAIFSAEPVKSAEDLDSTENASEVENTTPVVDIVAVEEDMSESSSTSKKEMESACRSEDMPEAKAVTEKVFSAELRTILEPYMGPTALRLFTEEQSRVELIKIIQSTVECVHRVGLMDAETKEDLLRRMRERMNQE